MSKYRYHIYPDRIYVISLDESDYGNAKIEITGREIIELLGVKTYYEDIEDIAT
jgi:hypothetical protein